MQGDDPEKVRKWERTGLECCLNEPQGQRTVCFILSVCYLNIDLRDDKGLRHCPTHQGLLENKCKACWKLEHFYLVEFYSLLWDWATMLRNGNKICVRRNDKHKALCLLTFLYIKYKNSVLFIWLLASQMWVLQTIYHCCSPWNVPVNLWPCVSLQLLLYLEYKPR